MEPYLIVFFVAASVTYGATFLVRRNAARWGSLVVPDERMVHERPTPTLGGLAMAAGVLAGFGAAFVLTPLSSIVRSTSEIYGVVLATLAMVFTGFIDDMRDVSAPAKMAGQFLAGILLTVFGATMYYLRIPFLGVIVLGSSFILPLTIFWVVVLTNALNLIDGLDGLAAGITAIASGSFFIYSQSLVGSGALPSNSIGPLIAIVTAAVAIGFLPHNFHSARIFMGDTGALMLGVLMASSTSVVGGRTSDVSGETFYFYAPVLIPLLILGVPLFDMAFAFFRRAYQRKSFAEADKSHLHHRLMRLGHGHRRTVIILWLWTLLLCTAVLIPYYVHSLNAEVPGFIAIIALAYYSIFLPKIRDRFLDRPYPRISSFIVAIGRPFRRSPGEHSLNRDKKSKVTLKAGSKVGE